MDILANNKERLLVYYPEKETLEVHWLGEDRDREISENMEEVTALFCLMSIKKDVVNLLKTKSFNYSYQKEILKKSLEAFYRQGGDEIVIINSSGTANKLYKIYNKAIKKHGMGLHLLTELVKGDVFMKIKTNSAYFSSV